MNYANDHISNPAPTRTNFNDAGARCVSDNRVSRALELLRNTNSTNINTINKMKKYLHDVLQHLPV